MASPVASLLISGKESAQPSSKIFISFQASNPSFLLVEQIHNKQSSKPRLENYTINSQSMLFTYYTNPTIALSMNSINLRLICRPYCLVKFRIS